MGTRETHERLRPARRPGAAAGASPVLAATYVPTRRDSVLGMSAETVLLLQGTIGNAVVARLLAREGAPPRASTRAGKLVQRSLSGKRAMVKGFGGKPSKAAQIKRSDYNKILKILRNYERAEHEKGRYPADPWFREQVGELKRLCFSWLNDDTHKKECAEGDRDALGRQVALLNLQGAVAQEEAYLSSIARDATASDGRGTKGKGKTVDLPGDKSEISDSDDPDTDVPLASSARGAASADATELTRDDPLLIGFRRSGDFMISPNYGYELPGVGWKAHIGATPQTVREVFRTASLLLRRWGPKDAKTRGVQHKVDLNPATVASGGNKKFITIYTPRDAAEWGDLVRALEQELGPLLEVDVPGEQAVGETEKIGMRFGGQRPLLRSELESRHVVVEETGATVDVEDDRIANETKTRQGKVIRIRNRVGAHVHVRYPDEIRSQDTGFELVVFGSLVMFYRPPRHEWLYAAMLIGDAVVADFRALAGPNPYKQRVPNL